jgi:hypothetical protein
MTSFGAYHETLSTNLVQLTPPLDPGAMLGVHAERNGFLEGYLQALEDCKTTWRTTELWSREIVQPDIARHLGAILTALERRLGVEPAARGVATGMIPPVNPSEVPAAGVRESGP